jgi:hypothetical protein
LDLFSSDIPAVTDQINPAKITRAPKMGVSGARLINNRPRTEVVIVMNR